MISCCLDGMAKAIVVISSLDVRVIVEDGSCRREVSNNYLICFVDSIIC